MIYYLTLDRLLALYLYSKALYPTWSHFQMSDYWWLLAGTTCTTDLRNFGWSQKNAANVKSLRPIKKCMRSVSRQVTDTMNNGKMIPFYNTMFLALSNQPSPASVNSALPSQKAKRWPEVRLLWSVQGWNGCVEESCDCRKQEGW